MPVGHALKRAPDLSIRIMALWPPVGAFPGSGSVCNTVEPYEQHRAVLGGRSLIWFVREGTATSVVCPPQAAVQTECAAWKLDCFLHLARMSRT
jgi:hypothetical protein